MPLPPEPEYFPALPEQIPGHVDCALLHQTVGRLCNSPAMIAISERDISSLSQGIPHFLARGFRISQFTDIGTHGIGDISANTLLAVRVPAV